MNQLKITCPSCNEVFSADDALQNHLKAKEAKIQEEMKTKEKMLDAKYKLELIRPLTRKTFVSVGVSNSLTLNWSFLLRAIINSRCESGLNIIVVSLAFKSSLFTDFEVKACWNLNSISWPGSIFFGS